MKKIVEKDVEKELESIYGIENCKGEIIDYIKYLEVSKKSKFANYNIVRDYKALEKSYDKRKKEPRVQVYYAHPYRSGERGSNENANRLIRRFIPKGTVITDISEEFIQQVEDWINNLLRQMFGFRSSLEMAKIVS